jgi:hypothetical protein
MNLLLLYALEFVAIFIGVALFRKFIYKRKTPFDRNAVYLSVFAALYIWTIWVSIDLLGPDMGFIVGIVFGFFAVKLLEGTVDFLREAGY